MTKLRTIILTIVACLAALAIASWFSYRAAHSMKVAHPQTAGDASAQQRVLIATQGSAFKDALVDSVVEYLKPRAVYVQVIDVSALPGVRANEWTAIVMLHTWEFNRPPAAVKSFVDRLQDRSRLIDVTTSGNGRAKMPGVDVISAASVMQDVPLRLGEITPRLDALLRTTVPQARPVP